MLSALLDDYSAEELTRCIEGAYGSQWDTQTITPVSAIGEDWLLELFHGPTSAFKDVALQMLPRLQRVTICLWALCLVGAALERVGARLEASRAAQEGDAG